MVKERRGFRGEERRCRRHRQAGRKRESVLRDAAKNGSEISRRSTERRSDGAGCPTRRRNTRMPSGDDPGHAGGKTQRWSIRVPSGKGHGHGSGHL